jgi:hypothetical protein
MLPLGNIIRKFNFAARKLEITTDFTAPLDDLTLHTFRCSEVYNVEYLGSNIWGLPDLGRTVHLTDWQLLSVEPR